MSSRSALSYSSQIQRALQREVETAQVDFKSSCNPGEKGEFLEIIKDIVAMANSGGGLILFGLRNDGTPSGADLSGIAKLDPAKITDAIYKFTDCQFQDFEIRSAQKADTELWAIVVGSAPVPLVFSQTGNYLDPVGKQKNAFLGGSVYFRHGAKSETGNTEDLRLFVERRLELIRREWMDGIARVVDAPSGSTIQILAPGEVTTSAASIQLTTSPAAQVLPVGSIDKGWPHRQKEVVAEVNKALAGAKVIHGTNVWHVRRAYNVEENGTFCYTQMHVSPKYSEAFVSWIVDQYHADPEFFEKAKLAADQKKNTSGAAA